MGKVRGDRVSFDPDRIVMAGGATGAHETVAFYLADPDEALLVPTPYYPCAYAAVDGGSTAQSSSGVSLTPEDVRRLVQDALKDVLPSALTSAFATGGEIER
ncbi:unnamed protein product [Linum tenue]|uniref:Aminotransferase class I/classII large domain-containing protein n=1 Tax=Linum tenue TaxID=586396 RepID=A0AAV0MDA0_9ROSI|nr:unnamed protein product [Linum tenue]